MGFFKAFWLCRELERKGQASLIFPAYNFVLLPEVERRQDVQEALVRYRQIHAAGGALTTLAKVVVVGAVLWWGLVI